MKIRFLRLSLISALLVLPTLAWSQTPTALTLPVNDTVFLYGVPYHATGTLLLTPVDTAATAPAAIPLSTPTPLPTPVTTPVTTPIPPVVPPTVVVPPVVTVTPPAISPVGDPQIFGYRNGKRDPSPGPMIVGSTCFIEGQNFGTTPGSVTWNNGPLLVQAWKDTEIAVLLPSAPTNTVPGSLTVNRSDGRFTTVVAFTLLSGP